ncbi:Endoribonuclease Dicer 4 [Zea mays]|uniref:protein-serine/threonine phosphatase n=1 Tax=Zea mays TaxID=4577 RepID=A0A3L6G6C0_MAIZE|nr:Endoribonuclease Dicer 4 [Zea mays]
MSEDEAESSSSGAAASEPKDPRTIARKYQLDLCKRAVDENIIVYLGTGCGKTHIAVLLMYELGHLIRKPSREQAMVIADSTNFKVQRYYGSGKHSRDHQAWEKEMGEYEVLVMTPQILLHNLRHCFIRMDLIALLIFDECHHAQAQKRHPYAQIMKAYYLVDEPEVHFVWQSSQESSVLAMSRAFDDYYIMDCGVISTPEVTQRRTDINDQFVILATVELAFVLVCL